MKAGRGHPDIQTEYGLKNGWTRWVQPVRRGYLMACCDCGLVHEMEFRVRAGRVQMRGRRDEKNTRRERRAR